MSERSIERTEYLKRLKRAGIAIRDGENNANSERLDREKLRPMIDAVGFINQERQRVSERR